MPGLKAKSKKRTIGEHKWKTDPIPLPLPKKGLRAKQNTPPVSELYTKPMWRVDTPTLMKNKKK
jgi:hypothetical protein